MSDVSRSAAYVYVGPTELRQGVTSVGGATVLDIGDLERFLSQRPASEVAEPFTYVVDTAGRLLLAPRRSEHVACAGGEAVLGAGEIGFRRSGARWSAEYVSNQSTGYCPDLESWAAVARSLDRAGIAHGTGFTHAIVFRCCPRCEGWNVVREQTYVCALCDADLPVERTAAP
ncbi:hypothetical protein ACFSUJ_09590 [Streptomyces lusitanus]|uniref:Uncharacterized protein n=1 Tax=Streptomyces lusitanus TaxID=68232 RepID=A0ABU3JIZ0_9ACTN|nr:hypothetical protein [Streptomyces lusitanus]